MSMDHASSPMGGNSPPPIVTHTRLHGHWLVVARTLWIGIFVLTLVVFCANLLVGNYGLVRTIMLVAVTSVWFTVSLVLFWRKSTDRAILLFSLQLVLSGGVFFPPPAVVLVTFGAWWVPIDVVEVLATVMLIFVYAFPDGRFVPGFTRWLALGWIAVSVLPIPLFGAAYLRSWWLSPTYVLVRIAFYFSLVLALLYRYRRRSTPVEHQQIKWVIFAAAIVVGSLSAENLALNVLPSYFPTLSVSLQLHEFISALAINFLSVLVPLSIGIALLRYRLWDIDAIINTALVYGLLSVLLAAIYVGLVVVLQALLGGLLHQTNAIALVVSTLTIAALFQPVRHRIQAVIDQRFYRRKYDAEKILAAFGDTLRHEVDLATLSEHLVTVTQETMQPSHVSLWLRPPDYGGTMRGHSGLLGEPYLRVPRREDEEV
jgi:hypothetical protein